MTFVRFFILLFFLPLISFGQTKTRDFNVGGFQLQSAAVDSSLNDEYCSSGIIPEFPGGSDSMKAFAQRIIKYPKTAIRDSIQGKVIVQFIIDKNGKITDAKIIKSVRTDLDTLCLSMINQMPVWKAGMIAEGNVSVKFTLPINFILSSSAKKD